MGDPLRIGLVAGELSGDRLGAALISAIRRIQPRAQFEGIAGPQMREAGCQVLARSEQLAVMGLAEVLHHLPGLLSLRSRISRHFRRQRPHVFVGIDAPDFNLALERSLKARESMRAADVALLASGTVALECMLIGRPMVVAYRLHPLTYQLVRRLLHVPYVSLPNLLLGTRQLPEYLQADATPDSLAGALLELLQQPQKAVRQIEPFARLHRELGQNAAQRAAQHIIELGLT